MFSPKALFVLSSICLSVTATVLPIRADSCIAVCTAQVETPESKNLPNSALCKDNNFLQGLEACLAATCVGNELNIANQHFEDVCEAAGVIPPVQEARDILGRAAPGCIAVCTQQVETPENQNLPNSALCKDNDFLQGLEACLVTTCVGNELNIANHHFEDVCEAAGVTPPPTS